MSMRGVLAALVLAASLVAPARADEPAPERWSGLDEAVIEKLASEAGRTPRPLWFELEGDLALFLFLCAGIAGGSVLGYCFRMLIVEQFDRKASAREPRAS
ncbi:MAG: cobalt transporter [Polyangiaceae bacterium]